jgi:DNA repair exonuclease SbcCD ATPase subunit
MTKENTAEKWAQHLKAHTAAQDSLTAAENALYEAQEPYTRALSGVSFSVRDVAKKINYQYNGEEIAELDEIIETLQAAVNEVPPGQRSLGYNNHVRELQKLLDELKGREQALKNARAEIEAHEGSVEGATKALAEVKKQQPKASSAALDAMTDERSLAQEDLDRIISKLETAKQELETRQANHPTTARADELAAEIAMAEGGEGPSSAAMASAQEELAIDQEEVQRLESIVRGLIGLQAKAEKHLEDLEGLRNHVGQSVYGAKHAKSEEKVVKAVAALEESLQELAQDRSKLNSALPPGQAFNMAQAKIKLPLLYSVRDLPSTTRLLIQD